MAGKGLVIPLSLDPRDWIKGITVVERTLDDMGDDLGDVEDAGQKLGRRLEDVFTDATKDADDLSDEVGDDLPDAMRDAQRAGDRLERSFEANMRDVDRAADKAENSVDDLSDEVGSSAKEFGSAFRGDPVEALEEVQSLASELAQKFIPGIGGAVLSIAGGVAFSALIGFYERWKEEQEAVNERVRGFRDTVLDALGVLDKSVIQDALIDQLDEAGVSGQELEAILAAAPKPLAEGFKTALQNGDLQGILDVSEDIDEQARIINERFVAVGSSLTPGQQAVLDLNDALGGTAGELDKGVRNAQSLARVFGNDVTAAAERAGREIDYATRDRTVQVTVLGNRRLPQP